MLNRAFICKQGIHSDGDNQKRKQSIKRKGKQMSYRYGRMCVCVPRMAKAYLNAHTVQFISCYAFPFIRTVNEKSVLMTKVQWHNDERVRDCKS